MVDPARRRYLRALWRAFCEKHGVYNDAVPLFEADASQTVTTHRRGRDQLPYLMRSASMERLVEGIVTDLKRDHREGTERFDGLIYMMLVKAQGELQPLYIGKAGKYGKTDNKLSSNITRGKQLFCRWGDGYAYHIGDLSAVVCPGHPERKQHAKYQRWAQALFLPPLPTQAPRLKAPIMFWAKAWEPSQSGIWEEFGPTELPFLEYLLIGVAGAAFSGLLNVEGRHFKP